MRQSLRAFLALILLFIPVVLVLLWVSSAKERLAQQVSAAPSTAKAAVASAANADYCTPELQRVLRRVLQSCGLLGSGGGRGCKPLEARQVATMQGSDFNALFVPMADRAGIVQFDRGSAELDAADLALVDQVFADRRGASYFFVVSRASPDGPPGQNQELSRKRAESVLAHLRRSFNDPELDRQVGLLWLGEEYAQLEKSFCNWKRSGPNERCDPKELNRSAFVAWIDCRL